MGEKRKSVFVILLKKWSKKKTVKIELFRASDFGCGLGLWYDSYDRPGCGPLYNRYRVRIGGKWWPKGKRVYITKTEFKNILFKGIL